jgi:hypothetical protein
LQQYGVYEQIQPDTSDSTRYLAGPDGVLAVFSEFFSEHDHRFWGFDTAGFAIPSLNFWTSLCA